MGKPDLQAIIEKLKNINIDQLRNIDAEQIKEFLARRPDILINLVAVLATIIVGIFAFKGYGQKTAVLNVEVNGLREKVRVFQESDKIKKEYADFLKNLPQPILTDQIVSKLSQFASEHNIQFTAFSPAQEQSDDFLRIAKINIDVAAENYRDLVLFMKEIEDAPYTMCVEKWTGGIKTQKGRRGGFKAPQDDSIQATIQIGSIKIKEK